MATGELINRDILNKQISNIIEKDLNHVLEEATQAVTKQLERKIKEAVASRIIAMAGSDFNVKYMREDLYIRVKIEN